ncbi:hypothetical protein [Achromobacter kerstersii]|uniref:OmpA/MotB family protein n=1 Tax=Achromobacter kerstersii TaxID=1353890 RepID=UPI003209E362
MEKIFGSKRVNPDDGEHWMSISDLMSGLMIVFLFVSIAMMHFVRVERDRIKEIAMAYRETQVSIYNDLQLEFAADLQSWGAEIDKETLEVRFLNPDVLFISGRADLRRTFKDVLDAFFPRYLSVIFRYQGKIDEIRIEGHTSSDWASGASVETAYFHNMALSQSRTREVLQYVHSLANSDTERDWIRGKIAAVGFSSARPVQKSDGVEDVQRSRRVSFRVISDSATQIKRIINDGP